MVKKIFLLGGVIFFLLSSVNVFGKTSDKENILNGNFANGATSWFGGFYAPGSGNMNESNGELHIGITNGGTATWNVQINQGNLNLISGAEYTFSFDARSVADRTIEANVGMSEDPYVSYFASGPLKLNTKMNSYSFTFTATANDPKARVEFNCGLNTNDVYIDNVRLTGGSTSTPTSSITPEIVNFPDKNLETTLRTELNIGNAPIYNTDVNTITREYLPMQNITDITGLEYFNSLSELILGNNYVQNLEPIKNLTNLRELNVGSNHLSDITPLENLDNLKSLNLSVNDISDITPLKNLTNMTNLIFDFNELINVSSLKNLTKMTYLDLSDNKINDISPLKNLINLTYLDLNDNNIADVMPLANCTKLTELNLCGNPISDITALGKMKNLEKLVLNVKNVENIESLANCTNLVSLNLSHNSIKDITPLENLTSLKVLFLIDNPLNEQAQAVIDKLIANGTIVQWSEIKTSSTNTNE